MLNDLLKNRSLLPILTMNDGTPVTPENWAQRRVEMMDALITYSYGLTPPAPIRVWGEITSDNPKSHGGKVREQKIRLSFETDRGVFSFPVYLFIPNRTEKPPVFLHIAFRFTAKEDEAPLTRVPLEEIMDSGYALAQVCYLDMVNDNHFGDYTDGIAAHFGTTLEREPAEWGKIGMWAYGTSRFLDYLLTRDDLDAEHTAVVGHSRLGKTALWCGAQDERFFCTISNNSGYGGAATSKHGHGERVRDFLRAGSWDWYCENFKQFTDEKEDEKPYDQAYLLALVAPRHLYVGSAKEDRGADPESEFLTTLWASQAWDMLGTKGLITENRMPRTDEVLQSGDVGYHVREGGHFFSREDWINYIRFMDKKLGR